MSNSTTIFQSIIRIIESLLKDILKGESKTRHNFFLDMCFGILKSSSIVLNDIAHSLNEKVTLKKVNERLYKNLMKEIDLSVGIIFISKCLSYLGNKEKIFIVDDSDIIKPFGNKFECLSKVKDGSSLKSEYVKGYLVTSIIGLTNNFKQPICLYNKIHNVNEKGYKSTNFITNQGLIKIFSHLKEYEGFFVYDRAYDDVKLMNLMINNKQYFLIRIRKNRVIKIKNRKELIFLEAKKRKGKINIKTKMRGKEITLRASHFEGTINNVKEKLRIICVYVENSNEPMILLTNKKINCKEDLIRLVLMYISRWKIEEHFRFKKVVYGLENFRVKSLTSINNLCFILDIVLLVLAHIVETKERNMIFNELISRSKKIRDDVYMYYYQIASGIKTLFTSNKMGVKNYKKIERWESENRNLFNSLELNSKKRVRKKKV